jgi:hypothetical protein
MVIEARYTLLIASVTSLHPRLAVSVRLLSCDAFFCRSREVTGHQVQKTRTNARVLFRKQSALSMAKAACASMAFYPLPISLRRSSRSPAPERGIAAFYSTRFNGETWKQASTSHTKSRPPVTNRSESNSTNQA